ncbi:MAG TPA: hypothetical protein VNO34_01220 [Actinomycetota bacterium]|nr:hypothetical protein [Actinomycetota bacterium]
MTRLWPWLALAGLGLVHGANPAMGWLFAVALGLQERDVRAVRRALVPIALGHAGSIAAVAAAVGLLRVVASPRALHLGAGAALLAFGAYRLARLSRHPRWVGMRVGPKDLAAWSFLMSTAHGAGLMLVPPLLGLSPAATLAGEPHVALGLALGPSLGAASAAVAVHTVAMVLAAGGIAVLVFERVGLAVLRRAWVNVDLLWALSLVGIGAVTLLL